MNNYPPPYGQSPNQPAVYAQPTPSWQTHPTSLGPFAGEWTAPVPREVKVMKLILQDGPGRRRYERMIRAGWTADSVTNRGFFRGQIIVFSRPKRGYRR